MFAYKQRVQRDLARWRETGLIDQRQFDAMSRDIAGRAGGPSLVSIFAMIGAVLLCFGVMTFVAANWSGMSRLSRLTVLVAGLALSYGLAALADRRRAPAFREAAILAGCGLFGASIMLIAQMFHIDGHPPGTVLLWGIGTLTAGALTGSVPALVLTTLLLGLWSGWEAGISQSVHWWFLPAFGIVALAMAPTRWRPGFHLLATVFSIWIVLLGFLLHHTTHMHGLVIAIGLALLAGSAYASDHLGFLKPHAPAISVYGLGIAFAGLFSWQFLVNLLGSEDYGSALHWSLAIATLALLVGAMFAGVQRDNRVLVWFAYAGVAIELLGIYFRTLGTLIDTAFFFFAAGLLVLGLAALAWRLHRRLADVEGAA